MKELEFWNEIEDIGVLNIEMELLVGLEPVLFVCVLEDNPNEKYLVMTYNSSKTTYIMRKITDKELLDMLDKKTTMEETFRRGKEILKTYTKQNKIHIERYDSLEFNENMLPRKGATYNIRSSYILDYIKELKTPKFEISFKYEGYNAGKTDSYIDIIKNDIPVVYNSSYKPVLSAEMSYCDCKKRKIA